MPAKPRYLTRATPAERKRGDGERVADFIGTFARSPQDTIAGRAGELIVLRDWQRELLSHLFARRTDGRLKHRVALVGMPRKNGKSALTSGIALYGLFLGAAGAEVYSCAADKDQARIVFGVAKRMVELDPELSANVKLYRDAIEVPATGAVYRVLSSEAFTKEGLNPNLVLYDELHAAPDDDLWNVMTLGSGARVDPLMVAITTAGVRSDRSGLDSICYRQYQYGKRVASGEVKDPSFFFTWWEAAEDAAHDDPRTWKACNPAFGDLIDPEDFESAVVRTRESEFRIKRCNQWVASETHWLPAGAWGKCRHPDGLVAPEPGSRVVLSFDGSYNRDSTAIIGWCDGGHGPHGWVAGVWERPADAGLEWTIPRGEVDARVEELFATYDVVELAVDKSKWVEEVTQWQERFGRVTDIPQTISRAVEASSTAYAAIVQGTITHDGNPAWERHLSNAVVKETRDGAYITKDGRMSPRKIDLAVAGNHGLVRWLWHEANPVAELGPFVYSLD